ncbi:hypothetical protein [Sutcliffiella horikoshii]|uniref:hypothetical protein n=1 Tax=Sutcliffiella horikoshii TaxID=79883 RepID=UPI001F178ACB|nr:hypothetical protein [Sutcliffiella horikoshii]MCG1023605.1 hypothetical protein [Sutcliffiella horikoshii]
MRLLINYRLFIIGFLLMVGFSQAVYVEAAPVAAYPAEAQPNKFIVILCTLAIILLFSLFKWWKDRKAT